MSESQITQITQITQIEEAVLSVVSHLRVCLTSYRGAIHLFIYPILDILICISFERFDVGTVNETSCCVTSFDNPTMPDLINSPNIIPIKTEEYVSHSSHVYIRKSKRLCTQKVSLSNKK